MRPMEPQATLRISNGGVPMDLGVLKGQVFSRANGINAMGQVVGFSGLQRDSVKAAPLCGATKPA